jgi:hypothetical protein
LMVGVTAEASTALAALVIPSSLINFANQISIKLTSNNYLYWRTQVVPILRNNLFYGFVDGTIPCMSAFIPNPLVTIDGGAPATIANPLYLAWHQQDQARSSLQSSILSRKV